MHEPPYPRAERNDPPWWHQDLSDRVERLEQAPTSKEVAVLSEQVKTLSERTATLHRSLYIIGPAIGGIAAYLTKLIG